MCILGTGLNKKIIKKNVGFNFIHFTIFYSFHFGRYKPAKLSRRLQCLSCWIRPRCRSFLCKGQLAPVLRRRQCRFASIAVQYQRSDARSFPTLQFAKMCVFFLFFFFVCFFFFFFFFVHAVNLLISVGLFQ